MENVTAAINQLEAFIDQVNAFMKGENPILTPEEGQLLIDAANDLINQLSGLSKQGIIAQQPAAIQPDYYALAQNYPNPFNPETEIRFQLPQAGPVVLKIYNILGKEIRTLVNRNYAAGNHSVRWDGKDSNGSDVSSSIYFYQLQAGQFNQVKKMSLLR